LSNRTVGLLTGKVFQVGSKEVSLFSEQGNLVVRPRVTKPLVCKREKSSEVGAGNPLVDPGVVVEV
jgi:hypothetical protein